MNQRFMSRLAVSRAAAEGPLPGASEREGCPPGYYMLFVINAQGVPSVAKMDPRAWVPRIRIARPTRIPGDSLPAEDPGGGGTPALRRDRSQGPA